MKTRGMLHSLSLTRMAMFAHSSKLSHSANHILTNKISSPCSSGDSRIPKKYCPPTSDLKLLDFMCVLKTVAVLGKILLFYYKNW